MLRTLALARTLPLHTVPMVGTSIDRIRRLQRRLRGDVMGERTVGAAETPCRRAEVWAGGRRRRSRSRTYHGRMRLGRVR